MVFTPIIIKTISLKGNPKHYYTGYVNNKHHLYSFTNEESVNECCFFLGTYKSKYGSFPDINNDTDIKINHKEVFYMQRKPIFSIIEDEISVLSENTNEVIEKCSIMGIGLLLIHNFDFKINAKSIDIKFSASSLIPEEKIKNYLTFEDNL